MGVGNSGKGVDLEVFVRSVLGHSLDGSPVGEAGLSIVEPGVAHVLHVVGIKSSNALGSLRSWDTSSLLEHLLANLGVGGSLVLTGVHEVVVEVVASSDNLNFIDVVRVDGGQADTAVVHLASEDLISEEVVSEDGAVGVGEVVRLG